jgi:hypothetical protein
VELRITICILDLVDFPYTDLDVKKEKIGFFLFQKEKIKIGFKRIICAFGKNKKLSVHIN